MEVQEVELVPFLAEAGYFLLRVRKRVCYVLENSSVIKKKKLEDETNKYIFKLKT